MEKLNIRGAWLPIFFSIISVFFLSLSPLHAQTANDGESVSIPEAPSPPKLFNDYVGLVSPSEASALEDLLIKIDDSTSVQIAVVIVPTVGQYDIADYSQQLAQKWGIGQKDKNNGLLLVLAMNDRKSRIEVGYGLEGAVTDIQTASIQDNILRPLMRQKQYALAIEKTAQAMYAAAKGDYKATAPEKKSGKGGSSRLGLLFLIVVVILIIFLISKGGKGGRGGGGGLGDLILPAILLSNMGNRGGGGSFGSFSSGSGSFGGFGGGSFGGGGSSGSW